MLTRLWNLGGGLSAAAWRRRGQRAPWLLAGLLACLGAGLCAVEVRSGDGLSVELGDEATGGARQLSLDGQVLPGVGIRFEVRRPQALALVPGGFGVSGAWTARAGYLEMCGQVSAEGEEDCAADLVVRVEGCTLPSGSMATEPLLLPRALLSKLPLVSLRVGGQDVLALALPPQALAVCSFSEIAGGVELRFPFGFTPAGAPALRMRAPFTVVLYRTDPRWHFRAALARYYELFPEPFTVRATSFGGWFFAAPTPDLPNPQHFYYHEGGPSEFAEDEARGLGTFPYRESSSLTVTLPGSQLPKTYAEAAARLAELESQKVATGWEPMQQADLDWEVRHGGGASLRVRAETPGQWLGVRQSRRFEKAITEPFLIRGWSRAEGVSGERDSNYAIYVDVCYADGSYLFGQCASFATGTHDWAAAELAVTPVKPVAELRVYALLRGAHTGTAWFDDLCIGPIAQPESNWLTNPGFETISSRLDLGFLGDNVCTDAAGQRVVSITDNLSADVGPAIPMNLLRFTLNVDPDLPDSLEHPSVAGTELRYFDRLFQDYPALEGAYIDSVSAWCSTVLNTRREHWLANDVPFTYYPGSHQVAASGLYGMRDYLAALQRLSHPLGKLIFTNIHCSHEAFPLYLVSDVPGIESSQYRSEDDLFFYRACSYRKPLLLMNFMNLHGLDQRVLAEDFHLNAAFWGELPSTGRFVQRAYAEYGDVTHAYLPAIRELAAAGWQPTPGCSGARAERFGHAAATAFSVRRLPGDSAVLSVASEVLREVGPEAVAIDPVWLAQRPLRLTPAGCDLDLADAPPALALVRLLPRNAVAAWLLGRAREHVLAATRVRGTASALPALEAAVQCLVGVPDSGTTLEALERVRQALGAALEGIPTKEGDLYALSQRREVLQARQAVEALALFQAGALATGFEGDHSARAGAEMSLRPVTPETAKGIVCLGLTRTLGRPVVPSLEPQLGAAPVAERFQAPGTGSYTVRAVFSATLPGMTPFRFERATSQEVLAGAVLKLEDRGAEAGSRLFRLGIAAAPGGKLLVKVRVTPARPGVPESVPVAPGAGSVEVAIPAALDGLARVLQVEVQDERDIVLAAAEASFLDEPALPAPEDRVAVAACRVDSSYSGYDSAVLTDGVVAVEGLPWARRAWASADHSEPHWVSLEFAAPRRVKGMLIYWNVEAGRTYAARRFRVLAQTAAGPRQVAVIEDERTRSCDRITWEAIEATALRLEQDAKGGPAHRPGILWLREIGVLAGEARP